MTQSAELASRKKSADKEEFSFLEALSAKFKEAENIIAALISRGMGHPEANHIDEDVRKLAVDLMFYKETVDITFIYHKEKAFGIPGLPPRIKLATRPLLPVEAQPADSLLDMEAFIVIPILVKAADDILKAGPEKDIVLTRNVCVPAYIDWPEYREKEDLHPIH